MNLKALLTTFAILGSSSAAMARPLTVSASAEASWTFGSGPVVRDHRYHAPAPAPVPAPVIVHTRDTRPYRPIDTRWGYHQPQAFLLADSLRFNTGETRKFVTIGADKGALRQLNIEAAGGRLLLKQLRIDFANGEYQIIKNIDQVLVGNGMYTAHLDGRGRGVTRVIVYAENLNNGWRASSAAIDITGR